MLVCASGQCPAFSREFPHRFWQNRVACPKKGIATPDVKPLADLQGIPASVAQHCCDAGEPDYLIEDGRVPLAEVDSEQRDRQAQAFPAIREREERVQRAIARGYNDMLAGRARPWSEAKRDTGRIREEWHGTAMVSEHQQEGPETLTDEQKKAILEDYAVAMNGEVIDAREALEKIRAAHGY